MSVVVTGGAGLIGSALVWELNRRNITDIIVVDHLGSSEKWRNLVPLKFNEYYEKDAFRQMLHDGTLAKMKIDAARRMIREGRLNIAQIASQLGFSSVHYFSRRFKALTGMSPSEYARSVKMLSESRPKQSDDRANNM